VEETAEFAHSV